MDVALARAVMQKNAYLPFRDMVLFDRQLDIASLLPAFKSACSFSGMLTASGGRVSVPWWSPIPVSIDDPACMQFRCFQLLEFL